MTKYRIFAGLVTAAVLAISAAPARAQAPAAAAAAAPIVSEVVSTVATKPKPNGEWLKAVVIHADAHSMVVSEEDNERALHTFTYSQKVSDRLAKYIDAGKYFQRGDKVKILHLPNQTEALKIKGSPSKPL